MKINKFVVASLLLFLSSVSYAYTPNGETVLIGDVTQWENNEHIIFTTTSGHTCYVHRDDEITKMILLLLKETGKPGTLYCNDSGDAFAGGALIRRTVGLTME